MTESIIHQTFPTLNFPAILYIICDWILENRTKSHIWYFEKYQFQYSRHYISVVLDYSHARLAPVVD